ncbi:MAG: GNAT family N-acetyltransferase [Acidobacteria bacterium]|nr:GNAT family N-acetyltransferase [Acidobacteriota bacterium]
MVIFADRDLSQQLERTEASASRAFVETRARLAPMVGASWIEVAGAYAMFDGPESPITQTFGLGLFDEVTERELERIESFFGERGAPVLHEVSPLADPALLPLLGARGYRPVELTSVMYRALDAEHELVKSGPAIATRVIEPDEDELWARTSAAGWSTEMEGLAEFMLDFGRISANCRGAHPFLAELAGGEPIAAGMLFIFGEVALLGGASTIPEGRRQGGQSALLAARLRFAAEKGCRIAMMGALPGSQSQRNAEKNGFRIAYTRTKWQLMSGESRVESGESGDS